MGAPVAVLLDEVRKHAARRQQLIEQTAQANADYHSAVLAAAPYVKAQEIADAAHLSRAAIHRILNGAKDAP